VPGPHLHPTYCKLVPSCDPAASDGCSVCVAGVASKPELLFLLSHILSSKGHSVTGRAPQSPRSITISIDMVYAFYDSPRAYKV
jgi:hypothetical protein